MSRERQRLTFYRALPACILAILLLTPAWAGEVLYEKSFGAGVPKPGTFHETVPLPPGRSPYVLCLLNGTVNGTHRAARVTTLTWNGQPLLDSSELTPETRALPHLLPPPRPEGETLDLTLEGSEDSFVTVRVIGKGPVS